MIQAGCCQLGSTPRWTKFAHQREWNIDVRGSNQRFHRHMLALQKQKKSPSQKPKFQSCISSTVRLRKKQLGFLGRTGFQHHAQTDQKLHWRGEGNRSLPNTFECKSGCIHVGSEFVLARESCLMFSNSIF